jgi:hypothetical protein
MLATMRLTEQIPAHSFAASPAAQGSVWSLAKGQLRSLFLAEGERLHIEVLHGECWITMEGDANDYVLSPGSSLHFFGPGLAIVEALSGSVEVAARHRKSSAPDKGLASVATSDRRELVVISGKDCAPTERAESDG